MQRVAPIVPHRPPFSILSSPVSMASTPNRSRGSMLCARDIPVGTALLKNQEFAASHRLITQFVVGEIAPGRISARMIDFLPLTKT